jgi:hypothetical protein
LYPCGKFLFKMGCKFIFWGVPKCGDVAKIIKRSNGRWEGCQKRFFFSQKNLGFFFFSQFFFRLWVLHGVIFNVTALIWMWSPWFLFKKFYKFHVIGVLNQDPPWQKEFKLIHINKSKGGIWAMYIKLDLEVICKKPKKKEDHLIFMNFGVKKFTVQKTSKKEMFDVWTSYAHRFYETRGYNFWRLVHKKVVWRSYNHFLKYSYFEFLRKWFLHLCQKLHSLVKKHNEF